MSDWNLVLFIIVIVGAAGSSPFIASWLILELPRILEHHRQHRAIWQKVIESWRQRKADEARYPNQPGDRL